MRKLQLSIAFIIFTLGMLGQEFLHDSIHISSDQINTSYIIGITTAKDVLEQFPNSKIRIKKSNKLAPNLSNKCVTIQSKADGILFVFYFDDSDEISQDELTSKLHSVRIEKESQLRLQQHLALNQSRKNIDELYYSANKEMLDEIRKSTGHHKEEAYYNSGFRIIYTHKSLSKIKYIECFESSLTQDLNQEIYYKWKSEQDKN